MKDATVEFGPCCFCDQSIAANDKDPCRLTVETSSGAWQVWFCHAACFREHLTDNPTLEPAHF